LTLASDRIFLSWPAAGSFPTKPKRYALPPSEVIFAAVFAAPPGAKVSFFACTIGTGASGETLLTSPQINLSSMTSPIIANFLPLN